jgi:hypothetical protein
MERWSDKSHEDRAPQEGPPGADQGQRTDIRRASGTQRRVTHEPQRWRRGDRPTTAAEWEVEDFYGSFEEPRP